jgi:squalene-associated FAD-dependent desaturase
VDRVEDVAARVTAAALDVAVVGAGWAGCAAAVTLARAGARVTLYEAAATPGGRARRVERDGLALDNGQHLLVGAYHETLALIASLHGADASRLLHRQPLALRPLARDGVRLAAWPLPAPIHLAGALAGASGLSWRERLALIRDYRALAARGFRCDAGATVATLFAATPPRAFAALWEPLTLAALNTPPERASAQLFANVLAAAFSGTRSDSDFLVPAVDLSTLLPDAAVAEVAARGGRVRTGTTIERIAPAGDGVEVHARRGPSDRFDAVVLAAGPHQVAAALGEGFRGHPAVDALRHTVAAFAYESITTVYLGFAADVAWPGRVLRLDDAPGQWLFDRRDALPPRTASHRPAEPATGRERVATPSALRALAAIVISAGGPHETLPHDALAVGVDAQLRRLAPALPPCAWHRVIAERRATYACTPGLARPRAGRLAHGLYLAGDYTDAHFPATLEAAVRSGVAAADAALGRPQEYSRPGM